MNFLVGISISGIRAQTLILKSLEIKLNLCLVFLLIIVLVFMPLVTKPEGKKLFNQSTTQGLWKFTKFRHSKILQIWINN